MSRAMQAVSLRARRWAIRGFARAVVASRVDARRVAALGPQEGVVLSLHSVLPEPRSLSGPLAPETFDALLGWLRRHFRVTTFQELAGDGPGGDARPFAVLSFDDGYRDFLEYAMPILERHGVRANQNVVPGCVDSGLPPWNVLVLDVLARIPADRLRAVRLPGLDAPPPGSDHEARVRFGVRLSRHLKMRSRAEREPLMAELEAQLGGLAEGPVTPMLTARDVAEVARHHEVGLHSYEHDSMEFESDGFFERDVDRCLGWSAERLPGRPAVYAFPNGSCRESQIAIARAKGFRDVLLVGEKPSRIGAGVHPRITVYGAEASEVRMRIARAA